MELLESNVAEDQQRFHCNPSSSYTLSDVSSTENILPKKRKFQLLRKWLVVTWITLFGVGVIIGVAIGIYFLFRDEHCSSNWLNIHLVPHSHDDVGWIETPEQYYEHSVKFILNHVVQELMKNPQRRFVYAEMYYFWRWWTEQPDSIRSQVRYLIYNKQLEFAGGGWTMNDEAVNNYQTIIDQITLGLRKINETFGEQARPSVGWQIDTFGHSRETPNLLSLMGYQGLIFARIDENERRFRLERRDMEFWWSDRGTKLLTSVMCKHYSPPTGFNFEDEFNEGADVELFIKRVRKCASRYKTSNVLVPMGNDFTYYDAKSWFHNMDLMITALSRNNKTCNRINLLYSTPRMYIDSLLKSRDVFPTKTGDFFPYTSDSNSVWSGFYSSRPTLKYFERLSNNFVQSAKQLAALSQIDSDNDLNYLREALGVLTHHDALTGTSQQHVTDHYSKLLFNGITVGHRAINKALRNIFLQHKIPNMFHFHSCLELNISKCHISESFQKFSIIVYNSHSWPISRIVKIPVSEEFYSVLNGDGFKVISQMTTIPFQIQRIPGRIPTSKFELIFDTGLIPPLGFSSFYVTTEDITAPFLEIPRNDSVFVNFDPITGNPIALNRKDLKVTLRQSLKYYESHFQSGAYVFHPLPELKNISPTSHIKTHVLSEGPLVNVYLQDLGTEASQILRTYHGKPYVEFNWLVGPISIKNNTGKEIIAHFATDIASKNVYVTDTNGRGSLLRERKYQKNWDHKIINPISENYYPVTSYMSLKDNLRELYIITDRAQGGTSLLDGEVELLVHRRLSYDDNKGVNEALNETAFGEGLVAIGRHWLLLMRPDIQSQRLAKVLSFQLQYEPWLFFTDVQLSYEQWRHSFVTQFSGLTKPLPPNIRILTLEPWIEKSFLLRLEHIFEFDKNNAEISLKFLFKFFTIISARETALGADRWLTNTESDWLRDDMKITLHPGQIRTFVIQVSSQF